MDNFFPCFKLSLFFSGKKRPKPRKCKKKPRKIELLSDEENENLLGIDKKSVIVFKFEHYEEVSKLPDK